MNKTVYVGVRFDPEFYAELKDVANDRNVPVSNIVREGAALLLSALKGRTEEAQRKLMTSEYLALAIDLIIATEYPEDREKLLLEAGRRVEAITGLA